MAELVNDIEVAAAYLRQNEVVGVPTETVYGLAGNAFSEEAVMKIFEAKNRPFFDPLIVHIADSSELESIAVNIPAECKKLMDHFWPGPLTILLEKSNRIPDCVTSGLNKVAVRCPSHPTFRDLLKTLNFPLAAPSANPFGYISPTNAQHVIDQLGEQIPCVLDGGPCDVGVESTIVDFDNGEWQVLRLGGISVEEIESVVGTMVKVRPSSSRPEAPGMLEKHYAPKTKLWWGDVETGISKWGAEGNVVLTLLPDNRWPSNEFLSQTGDLNEAARNLFHKLRTLDDQGFNWIIAEKMQEVGLGRAMNDRLKRASIK
jgi:L-threonylcarbamoyladenylate synthase